MFYGLLFDTGTSWNNDIGYWVGYQGVSTFLGGQYAGFLEGCVVDMIHLEFYWPKPQMTGPFGLSFRYYLHILYLIRFTPLFEGGGGARMLRKDIDPTYINS